MELEYDGKQIIITYEEDGSKWLFMGFLRQVGKYYLIIAPFASTNQPEAAIQKYRVPLTREEYVQWKTEIVELTGYPKHSKFKRRREIPLDSFINKTQTNSES
jgi:hypothetical protein